MISGLKTGSPNMPEFVRPLQSLSHKTSTEHVLGTRNSRRAYRGINKSLPRAAVEDLRILRIHLLSLRKR
jgi:hypothetical protein